MQELLQKKLKNIFPSLLNASGQCNQPRDVMDGREKTLYHIGRAQSDAAGVDTGMTAEILLLVYVPIDEQLYPAFPIIGQSHHRNGARCQIQIVPHMIFIRERKAGAHDLGRQLFGLKGLVSRHQKKIKSAAVAVAQKEIFAHLGAEYRVDLGAGLHRKSALVVDPIVGDAEGIQEGIAGLLLRNTVFIVGIAVGDVHSVSPYKVWRYGSISHGKMQGG